MTAADLDQLKIDRSRDPAGRRRFRAGRWVAAALVLLGLGAAAWRFLLNPVVEVAVATVTRIQPSQTFTALNASGYVVAQRRADVASKATGRLVWLGVEEGSRVRRDQVLARLESEDLQAAVRQARANLDVARANRDTARAQRDHAAAARGTAAAQVEVAAATLDQARAERDNAAAELERQRTLFEGGMVARTVFDAAETRQRIAAAAVAAAEGALEAARTTAAGTAGALAAAEHALAAAGYAVEAAGATVRAAEVNASYTEIRAPFDGVVLTKNADVGDMVTPLGAAANARAAVVTLADPASLLVEADVSENSLPQVRPGQPCEVQLDSIPGERFPAAVHMIVPTADRAKGTVLVKVRFAALDPRILPEMSAKVAFLERPVAPEEQEPIVAVSPRAVTERGGSKTVFVLRSERAAAVTVTLGRATGDFVEVVAGLAGGERAILDPPPRLRDGSRVRIAGE